MNPLLMVLFQVSALNDWIAGALASAHLVLYSNSIVIHDNLEIGALEIVTEPGMISTIITWNPPYRDADGRATLAGISQLFASTGVPTTPFIVYGYAITNAAGTALFAAVNLDTPFTVSEIDQGITIVPELKPFPPNS